MYKILLRIYFRKPLLHLVTHGWSHMQELRVFKRQTVVLSLTCGTCVPNKPAVDQCHWASDCVWLDKQLGFHTWEWSNHPASAGHLSSCLLLIIVGLSDWQVLRIFLIRSFFNFHTFLFCHRSSAAVPVGEPLLQIFTRPQQSSLNLSSCFLLILQTDVGCSSVGLIIVLLILRSWAVSKTTSYF